MHGCISYLPIRTLTPDKFYSCQHILLTAEEKWDPYSDNFAQSKHAALKQHQDEGHDSYRHVSAISSLDLRSSIVPEKLGIAEKTLQVITQRVICVIVLYRLMYILTPYFQKPSQFVAMNVHRYL
jgi:formyltetrahydrofolate hydrolase